MVLVWHSALSAVRRLLIVATLCCNWGHSFILPRSTPFPKLHSSSSALLAKVISTFDPSDFANPTGDWPYKETDLVRVDSSDDLYFYTTPRFVTHIDDSAIASLTSYYQQEMSQVAKEKKTQGTLDILDLCSSWISHLPDDPNQVPFGRVVGVGMNEAELKANTQLNEYYVQDLNKNPSLSQFEDESFDFVCNVVSVDYLTRPLEIFQETHRILRPGGRALISFSNRCFPTKAVAMWLQTDDIGRLSIVGSYFHYAAEWDSIEALDIKIIKSNNNNNDLKAPSLQDVMAKPSLVTAWATSFVTAAKANMGDPMYVVKGVKKI